MLRWLFPETCQLCGAEGRGSTLCPDCRAALARVPRPICLRCGAPVYGTAALADVCDACRDHAPDYAFARAALNYSEEAMSLIHDLKYHGQNHLARALAPLLAELWEQHPPLRQQRDWVLIPVPVTRKRLHERGYNQAEELARALGRLLHLPLMQALERCDTGIASQTRLNAARRERNARAAYRPLAAYASGKRRLPAHLLLIDDITTTGATARACCRALHRLRPDALIGSLALMRMN